MADFETSYPIVLESEGGYEDHTVPGDKGGRTYAGIAQNRNADWEGWALLDRGAPEEEVHESVRHFFRQNYWNPLKLDGVVDQTIATSIYSTGVLQGVGTAARLTQMAVEVPVDGHMGPITIGAVNEIPKAKYFLSMMYRAKSARFVAIGWKERDQWDRFAFGWHVRALRESES